MFFVFHGNCLNISYCVNLFFSIMHDEMCTNKILNISINVLKKLQMQFRDGFNESDANIHCERNFSTNITCGLNLTFFRNFFKWPCAVF